MRVVNNYRRGECHCKIERTPNYIVPRLLLKLAKKPSYGYELIEALSREGHLAPDPGNLYRLLRSLEEDELVYSAWDTQNSGPARRVYKITDQGLEFLHTWATTIQHTYQSLEQFLAEYKILLNV
jgi:PadR family transcriptional regulator PadR